MKPEMRHRVRGLALAVGLLTTLSGCFTDDQWRPLARNVDGQIAYATNHDGGYLQIFVGPANGDRAHRLVAVVHDPEDGRSPAWSADGQYLAFVSNRADPRQETSNIYIMRSDGTDQRRLTTSSTDDDSPAWAPDSTRIAFVSTHADSSSIYHIAPDGSGLTLISPPGAQDHSPDWSPDGKHIIFTTGDWGDMQIAVMDPDGQNRRLLTSTPSNNFDPTWSPDGERIAFATDRTGQGTIWKMHADGTGQTAVTSTLPDTHSQFDSQPSWSPDGKYLVFETNRDTVRSAIYITSADGQNLYYLINDARDPAWAPK